MKKEFKHPEPGPGDLVGPRYWRSLEEFTDRPEFKEWLHREFPQGASEIEGVNRRHFLKIMAASFAVAGAGMTGCRRPEQYILPYSKQPEGTIPGLPVYFSTSYPDGKDNLPLVVETHQHRPTHIEGNAKYEPYGGATSVFASASVLNLYDPDRLTQSYEGKRRITREQVKDILRGVNTTFAATSGQGLAILATPSSSPTRARLVGELKRRMPRAIWAEYQAVDRDNPERAAAAVFGRPVRPLYRYGKAKRILSIESDFLRREPGAVGNARAFARTRRVESKDDAALMSRLYMTEADFSVTGSMADHRLRLASSAMPAFAALLAVEVLRRAGQESAFADALVAKIQDPGIDAKWVAECAQDLIENRGESLVVAGSHLSVEVQQLVMLVNEVLGATGKTVEYVELPSAPATSLAALARRIENGEVETLVILGGNPVYDAPADLKFKALLGKVKQVVRYGYYFDETALEAAVTIAGTHYLESWGDGRTCDGTLVPVQPMILPLFDGFQELEVIARLAGLEAVDPYGHVLETFSSLFRSEGETSKAFARFLSEGYLAGSGYPKVSARFPSARIREALGRASFAAPRVAVDALEVRILDDYSVGDGSFTNNGWMQECPDPMTKLTWDNAIIVSPKLATELGFDTKTGRFLIGGIAKNNANFKRGREEAPLARLEVDGVIVEGPLHVQPGLADYSVVVHLGYGRSRVGRVGKGTGFDAYPLTHSTANGVRTGARLALDPARGWRLANTQMHWSMEGRAILREANLETHVKNPNWVNEMGIESHSPAIYGADKDMPLAQKALTTPRGGSAYETPDFGVPDPNYKVWQSDEARERYIPEQQWGMTIDLNTCTGCNACVVACQSENNIPIVGKDQVMRGREMHWIRLDRYFSSGDAEANRDVLPSDPQASVMPVGCLHCEMAPCEQVCPVNATVHDKMGLNVMAYNRCVGTRYCANNCPYKVRRFNFFDYNKRHIDEFYKGPLGTDRNKTEGGILASMQKNPDVTVRMRGVMEKCTYCVQRIQEMKIAQRVKAKDSNDVHIPDGVLRTACQTVCPSEAIVFGDISDPHSAVSKTKASDRNYSLLGYLNTRPRTTYLARLRNPNPRMPDYHEMALSRMEYKKSQPKTDGGYGKNGHGAASDDHDGHGH